MERTNDNSFGRRYSLKSKKIIDELFESGIQVKSYPFVAIARFQTFSDDTPFKMVISAPKKRFRRAYQRNRIKRICREVIRLNKSVLEHYLQKENKQLAVFLVYTANEEVTHETLNRKAVKLLNTLIKTLDEHDDVSH